MTPTRGYYEVRFYAHGKRPSKDKTDVIATFYYYPSGGTLRDVDMNIVFYEPRLDQYRSFKAPRGDAPEG
jgi:hypothetical protein